MIIRRADIEMDKLLSIGRPTESEIHGSRAPGSIWTFRRYGIGQLAALGLLASGILLLAIGSFVDVFSAQPTLRLGTNLWIGYQPLHIARDAERLPSRVVLMEGRSTPPVMEALRIGTIDAAAMTLDEAIRIANEGVPVSIVLALDVSNGADVMLASTAEIAKAGPRGRRVGVETGAVGAYLLHRWLDRLGVPLSAVAIVDIPAALHHRAFDDFDIDFLATYEPIASNAFARSRARVFDSREIPSEILDVLVVRNDRIEVQRKNIKDTVDGWFAGLELLDRRFDRSIERLSRHQDIGPDEVRLMLERLRFPDRRENIRMFEQGDLRQSAESIRKWLATETIGDRSRANLGFTTFALGGR